MIYPAYNWGGGYSKSEVDTLLNGKSDTSHTHTTSDITDFPTLATVATSGSYSDLSNKPTIPTVNNATLTIQKNGTTVKTFTANASSDVTCNITVPTKTSDLTNDSGFLTSHQSLSNYSTLSNTIKSLSISGKTITYTKGDDTTGTLTTQDTVYTHPTSSGNKHIPSGGSSGQFLGWSADGTAKWVNNPNTNTWTAMVGATSSSNGSVGYVNAVPPKDGYNTKYLRADGTWQVPPDHTYTVNNATLTIQKNGTTVKTFTANASSNVTANITVPTKVSELTNDSGFITSDNTKIPLAGSNQISGSLIPATDNSIDVGSNTKNIKMLYTKGITIDGTQFLPSNYIPLSGTYNITGTEFFKDTNTSSIIISGGHAWNTGAYLGLCGGAKSENPGTFTLHACKTDGIFYRLIGYPNGTLTWGSKNVAMAEDVIPRSGGAVMTSNRLGRVDVNGELSLCGGMDLDYGSSVCVFGKSYPNFGLPGAIRLITNDGSNIHNMYMYPSGTWLWNGQAVQVTSDQRLKQQIAEIDNNLLDAWEDVDLVQFKYNDAVNEKGDKARLHTGYVVQQINEACKSHNVDISEYGLYCHEEYPERTEEVTIENEDGTTTKETKVIEEANEHYSLRYTETLVVECAYLRRENNRLKERLSKIEKLLNI